MTKILNLKQKIEDQEMFWRFEQYYFKFVSYFEIWYLNFSSVAGFTPPPKKIFNRKIDLYGFDSVDLVEFFYLLYINWGALL